MSVTRYRYLIVGGGLAGGCAAEGIREVDPDGSLLLVADEPELPYNRPPLTKTLWSGKQQVDNIYLRDAAWYERQGVQI